MPLSKTQITYLTNKLQAESNKAKNTFAKNNPSEWTLEQVIESLRNHGYEVRETYSFSLQRVVSQPKTKAMLDNAERYKMFCKSVDDAYSEAIDAVNLGGADEAMAMLRDFTAKLAELAR